MIPVEGSHSPHGQVTCTELAIEQAVCGGQVGMDFGGNPTYQAADGTMVSCGYAPTVMIIADDDAWPVPGWFSGTEAIDESMTTPLDCQGRCYANPACTYFSFEFEQRAGGDAFHTCYLKSDYVGSPDDAACNAHPYVPWATEDPRWHGQSGPGIACSGIQPQLANVDPQTCRPGEPVPDHCSIDCAAIVHPYLEECVGPLMAVNSQTFTQIETFDVHQCQTLTPEPFLERIAAVQEAAGCTICTTLGGCAIADETSIWSYFYVNDEACPATFTEEWNCLEAARLAVEAGGNTFPDATQPRGMLQQTSSGASAGCSVQAPGDWAAHWNDAAGAVPFVGSYPPVCQSDRCPDGKVCGQALISITNGTRVPQMNTTGGHRRQQGDSDTFMNHFANSDAACPWDDVDERITIVSNACCDPVDPTMSCEAALPTFCSIQCAVEAHKFYTECNTFLLSHFEFGEQIKGLEGRCLIGVDIDQLKEAIAEAACI